MDLGPDRRYWLSSGLRSMRMVVWSSFGVFCLSLVAAGPLRAMLPLWMEPGFELLAVISLFVLICLLESGGSDPDRTKSAA